MIKRYCEGDSLAFFTDDVPENVEMAQKLGEVFVGVEPFIEQIKSIHN